MSARVCVLRQSRFPGDQHVRKNVDALVDDGYQVDVICLRAPGEAARETYRTGCVLRLPLTQRRGGAMRYLFEYGAFFVMALILLTLRQPLRRYRIIEVYNLPDLLVLAAWPARLMGARILFYMFEVMPEQAAEQLRIDEDHLLVRALRRLQGVALRSSDGAIVVSSYDASLIALHRPRRAPLVLPNVPEAGVFCRDTVPCRRSEGFVLLTHGSLLPRYGIDTAIQAMPEILEVIPGAHLQILGTGEARPQLEQLARGLGLDGHVKFTGFKPYHEIPSVIAASDLCLVLAPVPWLLPNKLFEYAAMARPVLAARSPSLEGVFGETIAYFEPTDAADFARRVLELYADPLERERLAESAHAVYGRYEWRVTRQSYLKLHSELAAGTGSNRRDHATA